MEGRGWMGGYLLNSLWIRRKTAEINVVDVIEETFLPAACFAVPNCASKVGGRSFKREGTIVG